VKCPICGKKLKPKERPGFNCDKEAECCGRKWLLFELNKKGEIK
jgi:Zn-finger nucleic acid-binding protein